jgi:hypothetical protein
MTYDQQCEIARFAMRNDSFVRPNDLNDLGGGMRNPRFRRAKDSFRFRALWTSSGPDAQSRSQPFRSLRPKARDPRQFERMDRKELRKRAVKSLESIARVNLCASPFARPGRRFRQARTSACVSARQKQSLVSRGQSRAVSTPSIGSESGRTTVESWRFVKGLRLVSRPRR